MVSKDRHLDLSVGQGLGFGFGAAGLLLVGLLVFSLVQLGRISEIRRQEREMLAASAAAIDDVDFALLDQITAARSFALGVEPRDLRAIEDATRRTRDNLARLAALLGGAPGEAAKLAEISSLAGRLEDSLRNFVELAQTRPDLARLEAADLDLSRQRDQLFARVREVHVLVDEKDTQLNAAVGQAQKELQRALVIFGLLVLALFAATAGITFRGVRTPTLELVAAARRLASGDFTSAGRLARPLERRYRNELSELSATFGNMALALEHREQQLGASARFASEMASSLEVTHLCERALGVVAGHLGAELGAIYLLSEDGCRLECRAAVAFDGQHSSLAPGEGIPGQAVKTRLPVVVRDLPADSPFRIRLGFDQLPPRTVAAVPLDAAHRAIGVLVLASVRELPAEAVRFAEGAAKQLAVSVQNALGHARVQSLVGELQLKGEQLQAQNEELQSQQLEIQAQNEELQSQQEEIQSQNEELHAQNEELQAQADELHRAQESLREADSNKNAFLAVLSHELRNPLSPIRNSLSVLSRMPCPDERGARALAMIDRQTSHLSRLVDDLLDLTRISNGKLQLQRASVDLCQLAHQAAEDCRELFAANAVGLTVQVPQRRLQVDGDSVRLAQVVGNLLQNAAKFSVGGGQVTLALEELPELGKAVIRVRDTGVGMPPEVVGQLFRPFMQADRSLARCHGGLGLGLALVKTLVELHGGSVRAASPGEGQGSEFTVELPLGAVDGSAEVASAALISRAASLSRRVLIVEDNVDAAQSLRELLELAGHSVEVAHEGAEGIRAARLRCPDVVLCDIGLPGMDGYEVARTIRADEALRDVFLVALTGYALPEDQRLATTAGFHAHVTKPPSFDRIEEMLAALPSRSAKRGKPSA